MASFRDEDFDKLDYRLLQNGPVNLFQSESILEDCINELKMLGYVVHDIDTKGQSMPLWLRPLGQNLNFPDYFKGNNLDSFNDLMHDVAFGEYGRGWSPDTDSGIAFVLRHYDAFSNEYPSDAHAVADIIANNSRLAMLAGNRMIVLLQVDSGSFELAPLGATTPQWNAREALASSRKK